MRLVLHAAQRAIPRQKRGKTQNVHGLYSSIRDCESGVLEMNDALFAETLMAQYATYAAANISGSPGVDLRPMKDSDDTGDKEDFPH